MASRPAAGARRLFRPACDGGFSLLEIVIAIALLGIAMAAAGPQMVTSIRATGTAKLVAQAKGVLQGQLDAMRTLPYRVAPSAGDHRDLLDTYYRNVAAPAAGPACGTSQANPPSAVWNGYVAASNAARCSYELAGVAMYRKVLPPGSPDLPAGFAVVLNTMFVTGEVTPRVVGPATGYNSQVAGKDYPPSSQVGVTATVLYADRSGWKPVTAYTQIASRTPAETRIKLHARATAVEIGSATTGGEAISLTGGQLDLSGSLSTTSQARASLSAVGSGSSVDGRVEGASLSEDAPYTNLVNLNATSGGLLTGCSGPCWGATLIPPFVLAADNGLPRAGVQGLPSVLNPVQTQLPDLAIRDGFQYRAANPSLSGLVQPLVSLDTMLATGSQLTNVTDLHNCAFSLTGAVSHLTGSGYLNSTDELALTSPLSVEACGGAHTDVIRLLPTTFAPDGLIRITARSAARCTVSGINHTPATEVSYRAEVEYWRWIPGVVLLGIEIIPGHGGYVSAGDITPNTTTDPLTTVPLTTPVTSGRTLGDYIESWAGLTKDHVTRIAAQHVAEATIPALVTVQTRPVAGAGAPGTAVSVAVGAASCRAEDNR